MKKLLSIILIFVVTLLNTYAAHVIGGDISYKHIGKKKYLITLKVYRDCTGINLGGILGYVTTDSFSHSFSPKKIGVKDITPLCPSQVSSCKSSTSTNIGIEEHLYQYTIDLNDSIYKAWIKKGACEISFNMNISSRNTNITNLNTGSNLFVEAILNICNVEKTLNPYNSSPILTSNPMAFLCCNNPYYYNPGASENIDYDSLSYSLITPKSSYKTNATYKSPYSSKYPMSPKCIPPGRVNCAAVPNAKPPLGIYLDQKNGDFVFTPTRCNEVGVIALEIKEYRKDTMGNYLHVGTITRDMQMIVMNCGSNWPPEIKSGKYKYAVCEGDQIKITIDGTDQPHPSDPNGKKDTVTLDWNGGISLGSFSVKNPKSREKKAEFVWQTKLGDAQDAPYTFTVKAKDDACPLTAVSIKGFSIKVLPRAQILSKTISTYCDKIIVNAAINKDNYGPYIYTWQVFDSAAITVLVDAGSKAKDTLAVKTKSTFYVRLILNNKFNCPNIYWDTVRFNPVLNNLYLGKDTTITIKDSLILNAGNGYASYLWSDKSTDSIAVVRPIDIGLGTHTYSVEITTKTGCKYSDDIKVTIEGCKDNIVPTFYTESLNYTVCEGDKLEFDLEVRDTTSINYQRIDSVIVGYLSNKGTFTLADTTTKNKKGTFSWQTVVGDASSIPFIAKFEYYDDACPNAIQYKQIAITIVPLPKATFNNYEACGRFYMQTKLSGGFIKPAKYNWNMVDQNTSKNVFTSSQVNPTYKTSIKTSYEITLNLENGNGCKNTFTDTQTLTPYPNKDLIGGDRVLYTLDTLVLNAKKHKGHYWGTGSRADTLELIGQDLGLGITTVFLIATDSNDCTFADTIEVDVQCSPRNSVRIGSDLTIGLWDSITFKSNRSFTSYLWHNKAKTNSIKLHGHLLGLGKHSIAIETNDKVNCKYRDTIELTIVNKTISNKETETTQLIVYPSPTKDNIFITLPTNFKKGTVRIMDLNGKVILREEIGLANEKVEIRTLHLPQGTYLIELEDLKNSKIYKNKFVKK